MKLGASLPVGDIGTGAAVIRDYAQTLEGLGFDYLQAPDHVMGGDLSKHTGKARVGSNETAYHDPFVLFSFIAGCTDKIGFASGVLLLPQRQTVLVAKQAACLDALAPNRLRLGIGIGWNELEFTGLGENFRNRGKRSEEQIDTMRALWANHHVDIHGKYHTIDNSGINPRPASGRVPVWIGGHADAVVERTARMADGWMPLAFPPTDAALKAFDKLRALTREAGRKPEDLGIEVWVSLGNDDPAQWHKDVSFWKKAGATHVTGHTTYASGHHKRIEGKTAAAHLAAVKKFHDAVKDLA